MLDIYTQRLQLFQNTLSTHDIVLLSKAADIFYYTGFVTLLPEEREAFVVVTKQKVVVFHAAFSPVTAVPGFEYQDTTSLETVRQTIEQLVGSTVSPAEDTTDSPTPKLLLDYSSLFVSEFKVLEKIEQAGKLQISPLNQHTIVQQRMIKDEAEQDAIKRAADLTKAAWAHVQTCIKTGITETELAWEIESYIKSHGGLLAFPTIVAYGGHAALPHHQPTSTALEEETAVLFDFGAKVDWYCADMTRTIWFGKQPSQEFIIVEAAVKTAYQKALAVCQEFVDTVETVAGSNSTTAQPTVADVDKAARTSLDTAGYGKNFIHTTGHGLGIEIHEQPSVYRTNPTPLKLNMAITIEPGVYLPEKLGYRYENTVLLQAKKVVELTA
jgi:Xaa-Pro aminopeptidase